MEWQEAAESELKKAPVFIRGHARKAVEKYVREQGREAVTAEDVKAVQEKYFSIIKPKSGGPRIAIVRCETVSEVCPGTACLKAFQQRKLAFSGYGSQAELIGFFTCGGCSGRRVARLVDRLLDFNLDIVHLSSCMLLDKDYPRCPHLEEIKASLENKGVKIAEGTHH